MTVFLGKNKPKRGLSSTYANNSVARRLVHLNNKNRFGSIDNEIKKVGKSSIGRNNNGTRTNPMAQLQQPPYQSQQQGRRFLQSKTRGQMPLCDRKTPGLQLQVQQQRQQQQPQQPKQIQQSDTLEELMSDIAVLTQQAQEEKIKFQADVQYSDKLKQTKESLESKLAEGKYANATLKTEVQRRHDILASVYRLVNDTKKRGGNSLDQIKSLEEGLQKANRTKRVNYEYVRKIQATIHLISDPTAERLEQLRAMALSIIAPLEKKRDKVKSRLRLLRRSIADIAETKRSTSARIIKAQSEMNTMDQQLQDLARMKASTGDHVHALQQEIENNRTSHTKSLEEMNQKKAIVLQSTKKRTEEDQQIQLKLRDIHLKVATLRDHLKNIQARENQPGVADPIAKTDKQSLQREQERLTEARHAKNCLLKSIESLKTKIAEAKQKEKSMRAMITDLTANSHEVQMAQTERRKELEQTLPRLQEAKEKLKELETAYNNLTEARVRSQNRAYHESKELQKMIKAKKMTIQQMKMQMNPKTLELQDLKSDWSEEESELKEKMNSLKGNLESVREKLSRLCEEEKIVLSTDPADLLETHKCIENAKVASASVAALLKEHPKLEMVGFHYDTTMTTEAQREESLRTLHKYCTKQVAIIQDRTSKAEKLAEKKYAKKQKEELVKKQRQEDDNARIEKGCKADLEKTKEDKRPYKTMESPPKEYETTGRLENSNIGPEGFTTPSKPKKGSGLETPAPSTAASISKRVQWSQKLEEFETDKSKDSDGDSVVMALANTKRHRGRSYGREKHDIRDRSTSSNHSSSIDPSRKGRRSKSVDCRNGKDPTRNSRRSKFSSSDRHRITKKHDGQAAAHRHSKSPVHRDLKNKSNEKISSQDKSKFPSYRGSRDVSSSDHEKSKAKKSIRDRSISSGQNTEKKKNAPENEGGILGSLPGKSNVAKESSEPSTKKKNAKGNMGGIPSLVLGKSNVAKESASMKGSNTPNTSLARKASKGRKKLAVSGFSSSETLSSSQTSKSKKKKTIKHGLLGMSTGQTGMLSQTSKSKKKACHFSSVRPGKNESASIGTPLTFTKTVASSSGKNKKKRSSSFSGSSGKKAKMSDEFEF